MKIIAFLIISGFLYVTPSVAQNISTKLPEATGCPTPHLGPIDPRCQEVPKVYDVEGYTIIISSHMITIITPDTKQPGD